MSQSLVELAELAEQIAEDNFINGQVNLEKIARKQKIRIIEEDYGDNFLGELVHENSKFYIHLNKSKYGVNAPGRKRFTIAHEYGHYFNDDHRNKLKQGISLAHTTDFNMFSKNPIENQANYFASNLILPKGRFIKKCKKLEPGFDTVLSLGKMFNASMECTAIRYISLDLLPCMFIKWNIDFSCKYSSYSNSLSCLTGLRELPGQ
ncbi:MAG: ImmA/IrrE family metallo-endopeptidase [Bacteroidota bacterium]